jgi:hypothetical protein
LPPPPTPGIGNAVTFIDGHGEAGVQDAVATECRDAVAAGRRPAESDGWFQSDVRRLDGFDARGHR